MVLDGSEFLMWIIRIWFLYVIIGGFGKVLLVIIIIFCFFYLFFVIILLEFMGLVRLMFVMLYLYKELFFV